MEGYPKRKRGDPTWSKARDDAYAQKERPAGEAYRSSPCGDSATPPGDHKLIPKFFCFLLQEQKEGLRGERCKPSPSGDSAPPLGDNILAPFTQNSLDLSPLLRYNYIEIFI